MIPFARVTHLHLLLLFLLLLVSLFCFLYFPIHDIYETPPPKTVWSRGALSYYMHNQPKLPDGSNVSGNNGNETKLLMFTIRSEQTKESLHHGKTFQVMGEIIIHASLVRAWEALGLDVVIVSNRKEFIRENENVKAYLVDWKTIKVVKDIIVVPNRVSKVFWACSWGRNLQELQSPQYANGKTHLTEAQILTPYDNGGWDDSGTFKANNTFIGFLPSKLLFDSQVQNKGLTQAPTATTVLLEPSIKGYLLGKSSKWINFQLTHYLNMQNYSMYFTSPDEFFTPQIINLGLLSRLNYIRLIKHVKWILGNGLPKAGTSITEIFEEEVFLLTPKSQLPRSLQVHPNFIPIDDLTHAEVADVIRKIETGESKAVKKPLEEFSRDSFITRVCVVFNVSPCLYKM
jgi:hypothetical protein